MPNDDPFLLPPQSVISFSGGRTSGLMLRRVLDAFGGKLPDDRKAVFCNTGKERIETLEFVQRCSEEWSVPITWLEYRWLDGQHTFVEVNYATADREGLPFLHAIEARNYLPNPVARFCTVELKMLTLNRYVRQNLGWKAYTNAVGLRADEPKRVAKATKPVATDEYVELFAGGKKRRIKSGRPVGETVAFPLFSAMIDLGDVMTFWDDNDFDLQLMQDEGNCDLCFLKGAAKLIKQIRQRPDLATWWIHAETLIDSKTGKGSFRSDRPGYRELQMIALEKQEGPGWLWADSGNNGSCGELDECRCTD
jgi:3'-phosphoadenosine 5'-phosphosulfate sulfotransferase (PAPS reductase)/FAD synthetase